MEELKPRKYGNVWAAMAKHNVTLQDVSTKIGIHHSAISKRLSGETPWRLDEAARLAEYFGTTIEKLFYD